MVPGCSVSYTVQLLYIAWESSECEQLKLGDPKSDFPATTGFPFSSQLLHKIRGVFMCSVCFHNPTKARPCKGVYDQHPLYMRPDDQLSQSMIPQLSMIAHAVLTMFVSRVLYCGFSGERPNVYTVHWLVRTSQLCLHTN